MSDFKKVKKKEFENFLDKYPRVLVESKDLTKTPPTRMFHDMSKGKYPYETVVAATFVYNKEPEKERKYWILRE